ncbi:MAG: peptidylprolyl isomerase [Pseudomonadota bacterium]
MNNHAGELNHKPKHALANVLCVRSRFTLKMFCVLAFLCYSVFVAMPAHAQQTSKEPVVIAKVNGDMIFDYEYESFIATLPPNVQEQAALPESYPKLLEHLIQMRVLSNHARALDIHKDREVVALIKSYEERALVDLYVRAQIESQLDESKVRQIYNQTIKEQTESEEVRARHILLENENDAIEIIKKLDAGENFNDLARQHSKGPSGPNGGDLGYFSEGQMVPEFEKHTFALQPGAYSKTPVKTQFGWHVVLLEDRRIKTLPSFAELEPQIRAQEERKIADRIITQSLENISIEKFDLNGKALQ